jgi:FSR family fosmidomycin resistance protein-like MFS transporter
MAKSSVAWFGLAALTGMVILTWVSRWYAAYRRASAGRPAAGHGLGAQPPAGRNAALVVLALLVFTKNIYVASFNEFLHVLHHRALRCGRCRKFTVAAVRLFLGAMAAGTLIGGPIGDRIGAKAVIWVSSPWSAAVHPDAALCGPVLDRGADGNHRDRARLRVSRPSWCSHRSWCRGGSG